MALDPSLFISTKIHEREVTLGDGSRHIVHFRELPNPELMKFWLTEQSEDMDRKSESRARFVAASVCDENGNPALPFDDAVRLKPAVLNSFFSVALSVNGFGNEEKKN